MSPARRLYRRPAPKRLAPRVIAGVLGFAVLGLGWKLTAQTPASAAPPDVETRAVIALTALTPAEEAAAAQTNDPVALPPLPLPRPRSALGRPLDTVRITSLFGMRFHPILGFTRMHQGIDLAAHEGAPVLAAGDGYVEEAGRSGGYGNLLLIKHANGLETAYGHLMAFAGSVRPGAHVSRGQIVGFVGHTGLATGSHLHYEVRLDGRRVNPLAAVAVPAQDADPVPTRPDPAAEAALLAGNARGAGLRLRQTPA